MDTNEIFTGNGLLACHGAVSEAFAIKVAESFATLATKGVVVPMEDRTIINLPAAIDRLQSVEVYANQMQDIIGSE